MVQQFLTLELGEKLTIGDFTLVIQEVNDQAQTVLIEMIDHNQGESELIELAVQSPTSSEPETAWS